MKYKLYVGGVEHAYSPNGACRFDSELLEQYNALPELPYLPLFNDKKLIRALYNDQSFTFTPDRYHLFGIVCNKEKSEHAVATNILIALVPDDLSRGNRFEISKFQGRLKAFGLERLATLHSVNISITNLATTNTEFVINTLKSVAKHSKQITKVLDKRKAMFDLVAINPKTAKPSLSTDNVKGISLSYRFDSKDHILITEPSVLGVGHFIMQNVALKCEETLTRELLAIPTFFLDKHPLFSKYHEMIWGIDKDSEINEDNPASEKI